MLTFFREWLPLAKSDFRILAMLAAMGQFKGNLSDLCRYFSLAPQTKNREKLKAAYEQGLQECSEMIAVRENDLRAWGIMR